MIQFYKGDVVRQKNDTRELTITRVGGIGGSLLYYGSDDFALATSGAVLIRRANEPEWPSDVPRCDLPLPEGKTRWAAMGWGYDGEYGMYVVWRRHYKEWNQWLFESTPIGDKEAFYAKAVNDEGYVPPQLSETTNSSQAESKITVERSTMVKHADLHNVASVRIDGGKIFTHLNGLSISESQALALAELLTAAAKEARQ